MHTKYLQEKMRFSQQAVTGQIKCRSRQELWPQQLPGRGSIMLVGKRIGRDLT